MRTWVLDLLSGVNRPDSRAGADVQDPLGTFANRSQM